MPKLQPIELSNASGKAEELLSAVQKKMGSTPNIFATMAHSPAALQGLLGFSEALGSGKLNAKLREKIALLSAGQNACGYCASAHTFIGKNAGLSEDEMQQNLNAKSGDDKDQAALNFAKALIEKRGQASDADFQAVKNAGFSEEEIVEILAHVALNTFTNYFNEAFGVDIDFPQVSLDNIQKAA